jgi:hypothetical protein
MTSQFQLVALLLALSCVSPVDAADPAATRTNVVLILADDLGWTDLACYGSDFHETPRLDRLAREGDEVHAELLRLHRLFADTGGAADR